MECCLCVGVGRGFTFKRATARSRGLAFEGAAEGGFTFRRALERDSPSTQQVRQKIVPYAPKQARTQGSVCVPANLKDS